MGPWSVEFALPNKSVSEKLNPSGSALHFIHAMLATDPYLSVPHKLISDMDPVTHGLIGASVSAVSAHQTQLRSAALVGAIAAMLPDLDVLIQSQTDPLLQLEYHRQFTHALVFLPLGALVAALVSWWIVKKRLTFRQTYWYSLIGMSTAGLVDVMTSYGVQWFWPFTDERVAWNVISVFDPWCSLGVLGYLVWSLYRQKRTYAGWALGWASLFFLFGWIQQDRATSIAQELARSRAHHVEQLTVKPTIANQMLWSVRYVHNDTLFADAVRLLPFSDLQIYSGTSTPLLDPAKEFQTYRGSVLYEDLQRFADLSDQILIRHPDDPQVIGDGRYALLPTSIQPLWGIRIDTTRPEQHVAFETFRDASPEVRQQYFELLLGN
jgi:inner membrane protein